MLVRIQPSTARGRITAPPSKSMAHRMLICAALAEGISTIHGIDLSQDILATIDGLRALGADITCQDGNAIVRGIDITCWDGKEMLGVANSCASAGDADAPGEDVGYRDGGEPATSILPCRESGSTLRFLLPLCLMGGTSHVLTGSERLLERPLKVYEKICKEQGLVFLKEKNSVQVAGTLAAGQYEIPGNVSSQFISGLLFVLPLLSDDSRIRLIGPVESRPYIDMTMQVLRSFGVHTAWKDERTIDIPGRQQYCSQDAQIEGDYSNAAFFDAFNLIGGDVTVEGLAQGSVQGDRLYKQYFDQMEEEFTEIDLTDCPDLGPILMVLAAMRHGAKFTGTARLRFKESSRGAVMKEELEKAGAKIELADNEIRVAAGAGTPSETLHGHGDHRIVMALAVLLSKVGGSISGAEAVAKSLPDFWERLKRLGILVRLENEAEVRREVEPDRDTENGVR